MRTFAVLLAAALSALPAAAKSVVTAMDYARAEKVLDYNLKHAVLNAKPVPHWIKGANAFWYERQTRSGTQIVRVDAATGARSTYVPEAATGAPPDLQSSPGLLSPDRTHAVFARDSDLWLRDIASGRETRLTKDGAPYFAYGKLPDGSLATLPALRHPAPAEPSNVEWLADNRTIVGVRIDERAVENYPFVESVPQDGSFRPKLYQLRLPFPGDAGQLSTESFIIDTASGAKHVVQFPKAWSPTALAFDASADGRTLFSAVVSDDQHADALYAVDLASGAARMIASESSPTGVPGNFNAIAYVPPNLRILGGGREAIFFSQADGWGHLYLYDVATGTLKRQITSGPWLVRDLIRVDEKKRLVYFTATGKEGGDPYLRRFYVASLDGGAPKLLTPEVADHDITDDGQMSPDGQSFIDTYSTIDTPPVTVLRATEDGHVIAKLEVGDASAAIAAGWRAPVRVSMKAADGKTDLWGVVYFPPGFDKRRKYPVIDAFYGGPQIYNAPTQFAHAVSESLNPVLRSSLAQLGFIVLTMDGRGTPGRSDAFHAVGYGDFADPQIEDHIAGIKQLAARFGGFDLDRVGVYGHSFGGYVSAHAILSHPEFYKVAVSSAGPHDYEGFYRVMDGYLGPPDYGNGSQLRPTPSTPATNYARIDNTTLAPNLRGHLMLVYGDMDENALPSVTLQLADALIKANKSFDLLYLPNRTHGYFRTDPYYTRRNWDYFVEHLLGAMPPENYAIKPPPK
jgi:dipeptidyl-peptidase 4